MKKILFLFVLLCTAATACGPVTPVPTATIPFMTPTRFRTATPSPAPLPFITPFLTPEKATYDLPQWLKNSNDHVLMIVDSKTDHSTWPNSYHHVIFIDLDTDERFDLDFVPFNYAFWLDKEHVAFLHGNSCSYFQYGSILDTTGLLTRYKADDLKEKGFCPNYVPRYDVIADSGSDKKLVRVYDRINRTSIEFHTQDSDITNFQGILSPDYTTLLLVQGTSATLEYADFLTVYSFPSLELKGRFSDGKSGRGFTFSQDGKRVYYLQDHTPCILELTGMTSQCGASFDEMYDMRGIRPISLDETKAILGGEITENKRNICLEDLRESHKICDTIGFESAICIYDFLTGEIFCPTRWLDFLKSSTSIIFNAQNHAYPSTKYSFFRRFMESPDGKFIVFTYSGYGGINLKRGILSVHQSKFYDLGEHFGTAELLAEWRPMP